MVEENQNVEWKESWRDEYLKWVCGFANAQGGRIYIGVKDDGTVVGVKDCRRMMEDIPSKIQDHMGITAQVNLLSQEDREYIEIVVNKSSYPVNYRSEYYYRSGSTTRQLKGTELTAFLLFKTDYHWEAEIVEGVTVEELDKESFDIFRREAVRSGRMSKEELNITNAELVVRLGLTNGDKLTRACVLLFHRTPEKYINGGCYVKIGQFEDSEILYQDEVHGSLILMADRVIDLVYLKYLKAAVSYYKETRVETYPYPREGIREAVYNALIHTNWAANNPIQIRVNEDELWIGNSCVMPFGWTTETLLKIHTSEPYNPTIAKTFYRAGYIENWGRGVQKIFRECKELGTSEPKYIVHPADIMVVFSALQSALVEEPKATTRQSGGLDGGIDAMLIEILRRNSFVTQQELSSQLHVPLRTIQRKQQELRNKGFIERVGGSRYGYWIVNI